VSSEIGDVELAVPRDRQGTFTPMLVPKGARRLAGSTRDLVSLYAGGMTIRDIGITWPRRIGTDLSPETISKITTPSATKSWLASSGRSKRLYPVIYWTRSSSRSERRRPRAQQGPHTIAVRRRQDGIKHVLASGCKRPRAPSSGRRCAPSCANRGVRDRAHRLLRRAHGFPRSDQAHLPEATVQTCVVHLIRARCGS